MLRAWEILSAEPCFVNLSPARKGKESGGRRP